MSDNSDIDLEVIKLITYQAYNVVRKTCVYFKLRYDNRKKTEVVKIPYY